VVLTRMHISPNVCSRSDVAAKSEFSMTASRGWNMRLERRRMSSITMATDWSMPYVNCRRAQQQRNSTAQQ
jgi:hypothetical protein